MILELQGADRMRNAFDRIRLTMSVIVGRVDAPFIARTVVRRTQHAVHDGIAQIHIRRGHIDLGAQRATAIGEFAGAHELEQVEVFFDGAVAKRTISAGFCQCAAIFAHLIRT